MNEYEAAKVGSKVILTGIVIGLLVAACIMTWIDGGLGWVNGFLREFWLNILLALMGLFYFGYVFGKKAGINILIKNKNAYWVSLYTGFLALIIGTFLGSLVGFFTEGLPLEPIESAVFDYIFKPFFWVLFFGIPFLLIVSVGLAWQIKQKRSKVVE